MSLDVTRSTGHSTTCTARICCVIRIQSHDEHNVVKSVQKRPKRSWAEEGACKRVTGNVKWAMECCTLGSGTVPLSQVYMCTLEGQPDNVGVSRRGVAKRHTSQSTVFVYFGIQAAEPWPEERTIERQIYMVIWCSAAEMGCHHATLSPHHIHFRTTCHTIASQHICKLCISSLR